jgi:hypothetical protein
VFNFVQVAAEDDSVESETKRTEPAWKLERVQISPETGKVA